MNECIILTESWGRKLFEVEGYDLDPNTPWQTHWLYAPDVMINTTNIEGKRRCKF
ncbi:MAG: hypothetical protein QXO84_01210 [Candidatus Aenigmatarchaeota archaeon]